MKFVVLIIAVVAFASALEIGGRDILPPSTFDSRHVLFHTEHVNTQAAPRFLEEAHPSNTYSHMSVEERIADNTEHPFLVHVDKEHANTQSKLLQSIQSRFNVHIGHYMPHNTWIIHTTHENADLISKTEGVLWVGNMHPHHKFTEVELMNDDRESMADRPLTLTVTFPLRRDGSFVESVRTPNRHYSKDEGEVKAFLEGFEADMSEKLGENKVRTEVVSSKRAKVYAENEDALHAAVEALSHSSMVQHIERDRVHELLNKYSRSVVFDGTGTLPNYQARSGVMSFDRNLVGNNEVIGIADSGLDFRSCFFADNTGASPARPPFVGFIAAASNSFIAQRVDQSRRKIVQYVTFGDNNDENPNQGGHGTHVSGSAAGRPVNGQSSLHREYVGTADQAKIAFFDIAGPTGRGLTIPNDLDRDMFPWSFAAGSRIHSDSWGSNTPTYTPFSRDIDEFSNDNLDYVVLVAAGNSGQCSNSFFSVGSPATAKNCIAVGASLNTAGSWQLFRNSDEPRQFGIQNYNREGMASFSSIGPTSDFRVKPDVTAPGFFVISARNGQTNGARCSNNDLNNNLAVQAGTSMATPTLAGGIATVREYFRDGFFPTGTRVGANAFNPSGALMKNIAINSARNMNGVKVSVGGCQAVGPVQLTSRPNIQTGFGRVTLEDSLYFSGDNRFTTIASFDRNAPAGNFNDRSIPQGETDVSRYCVYPSNQEVRITLVWTDPESSLNAQVNLVNDLDLLANFRGATIFGNSQNELRQILGYDPNGGDVLNNVEAIYYPGTTNAEGPLDLAVGVRGSSINVGGSQTYSLIVSGNIAPGSCAGTNGPRQPGRNGVTVTSVDNFDDSLIEAATGSNAASTVVGVVIAVSVVAFIAAVVAVGVLRRRNTIKLNEGKINDHFVKL